MNSGKEYATMIHEQNTSTRIRPLHLAWEFMPRPMKQPVNYQSDALATLAQTNRWQLSLPVRQLLMQQEWAVVVTDCGQSIQYVNEPFEQMSGYSPTEVVGQKPDFLQGQDTDPATRQRMRTALEQEQPAKEILLNYRKDGTAYWCDVTIFPVRNDRQELVNFIALEQKVSI